LVKQVHLQLLTTQYDSIHRVTTASIESQQHP